MVGFAKTTRKPVTPEEMAQIYEKIKTPRKCGAVIQWEEHYTDSPTVFQKDGRFYMYFVAIAKDVSVSGYETHLAVSDDLLHWDYIGTVMRRNDEDQWDSRQCAGYAAFQDVRYENSELLPVNGTYYLTYLAGNSDGYEPDPLYMGLAKADDPTNGDTVVRFCDPILRPDDPDVREDEKLTLYKSCLFEDILGVTGYPYVNVYNGKALDGRERIFLAVSNDGEHWTRYGETPVLDMCKIDPKTHIAGDPQILCIDDIYVMLFFHFTEGKGAYDTFACSRDLVHWTVWDKEPLIEPKEAWENIHAHKPWFIRHNGVSYHFYCAVNDQNERFIAVATSE